MQIALKIYMGSTNYSEHLQTERNDLDNVNLTKELRLIQHREARLRFILQDI